MSTDSSILLEETTSKYERSKTTSLKELRDTE